METSPVISTQPPAFRSQDFNFLRAEGLSVIQAFAPKTWTDHNIHDPGITLLEALCYAITEGGLRTEIDIKDLIASSSAFRAPEFFTAAKVLPVAPITITDWRKILIDHPLVNNAWFFPVKPVPLGRYNALLEFADDTLNSNNYTAQVMAAGKTYTVDIAFPHWDDEEVIPLREGVNLLAVTFDGAPGDEWNEIEDNTSFYARATVDYDPPVGPNGQIEIWIVAQITTEMEDAVTEAPLVLQQVINLINDLSIDKPLDALNKKVKKAQETMRVIRRYCRPYRNLCEDINEFNAVRQQEIGINAIIEVGAGVHTEELIAEIFYSIDQLISPVLQFQSLEEQLEKFASADKIFNGPLTDGGFLDNTILGAQQITSVLYTSDILRLIYQLRNNNSSGDVDEREDVNARRIISVRGLSVSNFLDNRPISTKARDCLQLVKSQRHIPRLSLSKSQITIFRNGIKIEYDAGQVVKFFDAKKSADIQAVISPELDIPVPEGQSYPVGEYFPVQNDLPVIYGVGEAGLPAHATATRQAQAKQLKGYLFLFEQMLAGFQAQLAQFNSFFSAGTDIRQTIFQQPLYHLPEIAPLFDAYNGTTAADWQNFRDDDSNAYAKFLKTGLETREQFLERRNAVMDHLLSILGEEMTERAALLLRLSAEVPGAELMPLPVLLEAQKQNRLNSLDDLLKDKSDYYYDVPELNRTRAQAYGNPLWRMPGFITITGTPAGFTWVIKDENNTLLFRQFAPAASFLAARREAEHAFTLATKTNHYSFRLDPGNIRVIELRDEPAALPVAESIATYNSDPAADNAIIADQALVLDLWVKYALIPLEIRMFHMLGIDLRERRKLIHAESDYIDIYDEPIVNPDHRKRFRLRLLPAIPGNILLESAVNYPGLTDALAIEAATAASELMIEYGMEARNYTIENTGINTFSLSLMTPADIALAVSPTVFATQALAEAEAERIRKHLFRLFSQQGLYIVEHHLLFPPGDADMALVLPDVEDPYSCQLTVILPSGYQRDFSNVKLAPQPSSPALYRNEEFRKYAEQQIRKHCPAHLLPRILWVDRAEPGTPVDPMDPCIDAFEEIYFDWLHTYLMDETDTVNLPAARNDLAEMINGLYAEYYTI